jgi:modification methylase
MAFRLPAGDEAESASIWVIGSYHNIFRVGTILQDLGFWILNDVVWRKTNPMPNFRGRRFTNAHETLIWAARDKNSRYTFNYEALKAGNEDVQMRSDWTLPLCTGEERLKDGSGASCIRRRSRKRCSRARSFRRRNPKIWCSIRSSAPAPRAPPRAGSGGIISASSAIATYAARAQARCQAVEPLPSPSIAPFVTAREAPRVPFNALIERGLMKAGAKLTDAKGRVKALVRADGTVVLKNGKDESVGSIHRVGAIAQGLEACNGWTYWHFEDAGKRQPIDSLRAQIRSEMAQL